MCSKIFDPDTPGARLVVSDMGDILSPKYDPETTAPAVMAGLTPRPMEIPMSATPMVPAVVYEDYDCLSKLDKTTLYRLFDFCSDARKRKALTFCIKLIHRLL